MAADFATHDTPHMISTAGRLLLAAARVKIVSASSGSGLRRIRYHGVELWLHPADHWSARGIADRRMALWCGYVIATPVGTVYVAGDTGYGDGRIFLEVADRCPVVDVAVLPIGAYAPRWFMKDQHVNPAEAVRIMRDCGRGRRSAFIGAPFH
jgi:L-ascorbate metabolism protein UlaG (beta-lactamase superfamily)